MKNNIKIVLIALILLTIAFGVDAQTKSKSKSRKTSQKPKISNTTSVDDDNGTYQDIRIQGYELSDYAANYIGKNIDVDAMYTDADQAGSWEDVQGMTLRPKSNEFEDMYAMMNYSDVNTKADGTYRRRVTIDGNKINLIITKWFGTTMPNSTATRVRISGKLINHNTIKVNIILREY
jgi:hypothetical protein